MNPGTLSENTLAVLNIIIRLPLVTRREIEAMRPDNEAYIALATLRRAGYVLMERGTGYNYTATIAGRRFANRGAVVPPRTISRMEGKYIPPKWHTRV